MIRMRCKVVIIVPYTKMKMAKNKLSDEVTVYSLPCCMPETP